MNEIPPTAQNRVATLFSKFMRIIKIQLISIPVMAFVSLVSSDSESERLTIRFSL
jgi:hypothetical protein